MSFSLYLLCSLYFTSFDQEEFENTKGVIIIVSRRRTDTSMAKRKKVQKDKQPTTTHRHKTNIE